MLLTPYKLVTHATYRTVHSKLPKSIIFQNPTAPKIFRKFCNRIPTRPIAIDPPISVTAISSTVTKANKVSRSARRTSDETDIDPISWISERKAGRTLARKESEREGAEWVVVGVDIDRCWWSMFDCESHSLAGRLRYARTLAQRVRVSLGYPCVSLRCPCVSLGCQCGCQAFVRVRQRRVRG